MDELVSPPVPAPPAARGFIVTVYGDVVEPRGGELWMGSLIAVCERAGISESLVRTAVSRLVASGHLEGERIGRRSYYRLTQGARAEFAAAARLFYGRPPAARGWCVAPGREEAPGAGWAALAPRTWIGPDLPDVDPPAAPLIVGPGQGMGDLAARLWPLEAVAEGYAGFLGSLPQGSPVGADALDARLGLVHRFRLTVLKDPRLPADALPADWPEAPARHAFARACLALGEEADRHASTLRNARGGLPEHTAETDRRRALLEATLHETSQVRE